MSTEPPVVPDAVEARRWAAEEVAKPEYRQAAPGWLEELWNGFLEWLRSLDGQPGDIGPLPGPMIGIAIVLVIAVAVILARPRMNAKAGQARDVFEPEASVSAVDYRQRAEAAAAAGQWGEAVVNRFRAVVRAAEDRTVLDAQPGRTADEVARALSIPFAAEAQRLDRAAMAFDAVRYGNKAAVQADYRAIADLDSALAAARPFLPSAGRTVAAGP